LSWTETKILNPLQSDFKYPSDFGFLKNCRIPSDSDADSESVTSLKTTVVGVYKRSQQLND